MSQIDVILEYSPVVNFAMQQNHVPVIRKLWLTNPGAAVQRHIQVVIRSNPEFALEWSGLLDTLLPGQTIDMGTVALQLSPSFLIQLTERLSGALELTVTGEDGSELYRQAAAMDVLAFDEWNGLSVLPEMVGAFVMPNHPAVLRVVKEAAAILRSWDSSAVFDAYQSQDSNRVRKQAAALYAALQKESLAYCVAPASFEEIGQRVRLPDSLLGNRMGNCLDVSLFYAACLEAVGLHPLVVFTKGHAFTGSWLVKETFADSVLDDVSLLTKRMASGIHEITLVEATALTGGHPVSFEEAERLAAAHVTDPLLFDCFVDLKRARASAIRPLPMRVPGPDGWEIAAAEAEADGGKATAPGQLDVLDRPAEVASISLPKQKEWERRLLDLTLRNNLLNFRLTRSSVAIMNAELGAMEDAIANGAEFQLLPIPKDWNRENGEQRDSQLFRTLQHNDPILELLRQEQENRRLRSPMSDADLNNRLVHLYRSARLSLEESGANTLYLALGLLQWYETEASQKARYAPLVLIPVELIRKSSRVGFILRARDEEPQFNITLLELLKQDFGIDISGLDPLPKDDQGVDLKRIFTTIRHAVMTRSRWDVLESAYLGLFSFSQFVMWNDLRMRSGDLAKNPVVASLMAGQLKWAPEEVFPDTHQMDDQYGADYGAVPISADSSQLAAVYASGEGRSFVLHGPPGTGKSQTITNMIANALAMGKKVLFVAEKMAALNVVQRRLAAIGLAPFCLELHSNKSKKKAVLEQLQSALDASGSRPPEEWERLAAKLKQSRRQLNAYVTALHRKNTNGKSVYDSIVAYGKVREVPDAIRFDPIAVGALNLDQWTGWEELAEEVKAAAEAAGGPWGHPWSDATISEYSPGLRTQLTELLTAYTTVLESCRRELEEAAKLLHIAPDSLERSRLHVLAAICGGLASPPLLAPGLFTSSRLEDDAVQIRDVIQHGLERDKLAEQILSVFTPGVLSVDAAELLSVWRQAGLQWLAPRWLKQNRVLGILKRHLPAGRKLVKSEAESWLQQLVRYSQEVQAVQSMGPVVLPLLGEALWIGGKGNWQAAAEACSYTLELNKRLQAYFGSEERPAELRRTVMQLTKAGVTLHSFSRLAAYTGELQQLEQELFALLGIDPARLEGAGLAEGWIPVMGRQAASWLSHIDALRDWCVWRRIRNKAGRAGLAALIGPVESGVLPVEGLVPAFQKALNRAFIEFAITANEPLRSFSSRMFEESVSQFTRMTDRFEELTQQEIAARLAARIPRGATGAAQSSELGILQRAIRSNGRAVAIRKLFEQIPNLLHRLCPCMLMSPISVAQYLDPANPLFDLVIFDEASQMPTCEAVGAMARGHHVIVVGDPKQLPPTSFFSSGQSEAGEEDLLHEDLESVLDDCMAVGLPQGHLLWHYRSRHESLIAFSNVQYYDNKLLTFPSPYERVSNVTLQAVEGSYDRGKTKQNRGEAEAVVAEIARRLQHPALRRQSIGVVTFSAVQQNLIEDLLDEAYRQQPELEVRAQELPEPIFVKNLENVQGDERDVILFSIGYGPDASGKVSMNFGPLNRDGGWRRLNVAVSRARSEMKVFSTLKPDQLNLSRTVAQGVAGLRAFLEYADKGKTALGLRTSGSTTHSRTGGIELEIADKLKQAGYQADTLVGVSGFRIDVAVVDPNAPARYLLGITCDGYGYSLARTARDREILQHRVAGQLGWRLHRIWSLDWWENPERELQKIIEAIRQASSQEEREEAAPVLPAGTIEANVTEDHVKRLAAETEGVEDLRRENPEREVEAEYEPAPAKEAGLEIYTPYLLAPVGLAPEEFYSLSHTRTLCRQLEDIIQHEGPISKQQVCRRVLQAWGMTRSGAKIERRFDELFAKLDVRTTEHDQTLFFWPSAAVPETYVKFRVAAQEGERRNAEELPPEEIANAVRHVLQMQISMPREDLSRETARVLGYSRSGSVLERVIALGIEVAISRGYAKADDRNRIVLVEE